MSAISSTVDAVLSRSYLEPLLTGDRSACRKVIDNAIARGIGSYDLLTQLVWPTMELIQSLYRDDRITTTSLNLATRLNRTLTDQLTAKLERQEPNGRKALIFCGNAEPAELGGQMCADLFEVNGWTVRFAGGGVPDDEVLKLIGDERPDLLVMFGTLPSGVPAVRKLIDYLREVNSCPTMQLMCCGGIYKRAEGLAEEIGADLYGPRCRRSRRGRQRKPQYKGHRRSTDGRSHPPDPQSRSPQSAVGHPHRTSIGRSRHDRGISRNFESEFTAAGDLWEWVIGRFFN